LTVCPTFTSISVRVPLVPKFTLTSFGAVTFPVELTVVMTVPLATVAVRVTALLEPVLGVPTVA
jgi:hypothetical protein